jgi:plastocyanin
MPLARATAALVALALLTGCGGDEPTAVVRDATVEITLDEYLIAPQNITAQPGRLTLRIIDKGRLRHSFRLWGPGGTPVRVVTLFPGDEVVRTANLAAGQYRMVCTVSNHSELGMNGTLVVR